MAQGSQGADLLSCGAQQEKKNPSSECHTHSRLATSVSSTFSIQRRTSSSKVSHSTRLFFFSRSLNVTIGPCKVMCFSLCSNSENFLTAPGSKTGRSDEKDTCCHPGQTKPPAAASHLQNDMNDIFKWQTWEWFPFRGRCLIGGSQSWNGVMLRRSNWPLSSLWARPIVSPFPLR